MRHVPLRASDPINVRPLYSLSGAMYVMNASGPNPVTTQVGSDPEIILGAGATMFSNSGSLRITGYGAVFLMSPAEYAASKGLPTTPAYQYDAEASLVGMSGQGGVLPILGQHNTIVLVGDGITADNVAGSTSTSKRNNTKGYWNQANFFLNQRFTVLNNAGVSSDKSGDILARLDTDVLAYSPDYALCLIGSNDIAADLPYGDVVANYGAILSKLSNAGITAIICLCMPAGNPSQAMTNQLMGLNNWLQDYASTHPGCILIDTFRPVLDYTTYLSSCKAAPVAAWFDGGLSNPIAKGAVQIGTAIARALDGIIPKLPRRLYLNSTGAAGDLTNRITNGMLAQGGGGTNGANATGVPQSWTGVGTGSLAGACTQVTRAASFNDGDVGPVLRVTLSGAGNTTDTWKLTPAVGLTPVGNIVTLEAEINATALTGTIEEVSLQFVTQGTVVASYANSMALSESMGIAPGSPYKGTLIAPSIAIPSGTTGLTASINIRTSVGATGTVDIANVRLRTVQPM